MRVLYVEDNEVNQALVARVMRARQNQVLFREEGEGALDILAADPDIDLILLDIELAGSMSGLDVIRALRARSDTRPVVAITAYAMMGDRERILEAGCDQYLPKPIVIPDLLNVLDHYEKAGVEPPQGATAPDPATPSAAAGVVPTGAAQPADQAAAAAPPAAAAPVVSTTPSTPTANDSPPPAKDKSTTTAAPDSAPKPTPVVQITVPNPPNGKGLRVEEKQHERS